MTEHPSYLELDAWALGLERPAVDRHLAGCERCRAHTDALRRREAVPDWLATRDMRRRPLWPALALVAAALLIGALAWPTADPPAGGDYVGLKGAHAERTLHLFLKRGDRVTPWRGAALRPDDAVRLGVTTAVRLHVSLFALDGERAPRLLFSDWVPPGAPSLLPLALQVDHRPGAERLWVLTTRYPLDLADFDPRRDGWLGRVRPHTRFDAITLAKESADAP